MENEKEEDLDYRVLFNQFYCLTQRLGSGIFQLIEEIYSNSKLIKKDSKNDLKEIANAIELDYKGDKFKANTEPAGIKKFCEKVARFKPANSALFIPIITHFISEIALLQPEEEKKGEKKPDKAKKQENEKKQEKEKKHDKERKPAKEKKPKNDEEKMSDDEDNTSDKEKKMSDDEEEAKNSQNSDDNDKSNDEKDNANAKHKKSNNSDSDEQPKKEAKKKNKKK